MQAIAMLLFLGYYITYALVFIDHICISCFLHFVNVYIWFGSLIFLLKWKLEMSMVYLFGCCFDEGKTVLFL